MSIHAAAALLYTLAAFCVQPALAHDPYSDWKTKNGVSCCHDRDCAPATMWRDNEGRLIARQNGQTYTVPEHSVL
ncbi:MAG: hypothetical protein JNL61_22260, partial [Rhizobiaceae bacterium]|nr:hypothetical protein [Rhizobiaceae bacterium]